MKKALLLTGVLLALTVSLASAQGLNLGWGAFCPTVATSLADNTDPCDNTGAHTLVGSLRTGVAMPGVTAIANFVDMQVAAAQLPDFWRLDSGECRDNAVTGQLSVSTLFTGYSISVCKNFWGTQGNGGYHWYSGNGAGSAVVTAPNRARLASVFARSPGANMSATTQYYMFTAFIGGDATGADGVTQCAGCTIAACWVYNQATVSMGTTDVLVTANDVRDYVTWQGPPAGTACPAATPTTHETWGHVKSLYR